MLSILFKSLIPILQRCKTKLTIAIVLEYIYNLYNNIYLNILLTKKNSMPNRSNGIENHGNMPQIKKIAKLHVKIFCTMFSIEMGK